jgi:hypothetical protein
LKEILLTQFGGKLYPFFIFYFSFGFRFLVLFYFQIYWVIFVLLKKIMVFFVFLLTLNTTLRFFS